MDEQIQVVQEFFQQIADQFATGQVDTLLIIAGIVTAAFALTFFVVYVVCFWLIFEKAGRSGWWVFIPIVNVIVFLQIARKPWWYLLGFLIPILNFVLIVAAYVDFAKAFGRSTGFGVGFLYLPMIFAIVLAFDDSEYVGQEKLKNNYLVNTPPMPAYR